MLLGTLTAWRSRPRMQLRTRPRGLLLHAAALQSFPSRPSRPFSLKVIARRWLRSHNCFLHEAIGGCRTCVGDNGQLVEAVVRYIEAQPHGCRSRSECRPLRRLQRAALRFGGQTIPSAELIGLKKRSRRSSALGVVPSKVLCRPLPPLATINITCALCKRPKPLCRQLIARIYGSSRSVGAGMLCVIILMTAGLPLPTAFAIAPGNWSMASTNSP
jgi:hypothetical protein